MPELSMELKLKQMLQGVEMSCSYCTDRYMVFCQDALKQTQECLSLPASKLKVFTSMFTKIYV